MPEGPLGFPRLTTLGPFVKPSKIQPHKDIDEGVYPLGFIEEVQSLTGRDTRRALEDIIDFDLQLEGKFRPEDVEFRYRKEKIADLLDVNEFSSSLLEAMSKAEEKGIPLQATENDMLILENDELEREVRAHMDGEESLFTDDLLGGIDANWTRIVERGDDLFRPKSEMMDEIVEKVIGDFDAVTEINEDIRDERVYFPPTTESVELGAPVGWGTIDGAHRIVALSQILGTDEEIFIWEWENQEMFIEESSVM